MTYERENRERVCCLNAPGARIRAERGCTRHVRNRAHGHPQPAGESCAERRRERPARGSGRVAGPRGLHWSKLLSASYALKRVRAIFEERGSRNAAMDAPDAAATKYTTAMDTPSAESPGADLRG
eukprot:5020780-Prymnesium_polylepis.1